MNASFGLILPQDFVFANFTVAAQEIRHWGDEVIEIGEPRLVCASLEGAFFQALPVTGFVRQHLANKFLSGNPLYLSINGDIVDAYVQWLADGDMRPSDTHVLEVWLLDLMVGAGSGAILFAPEGDRLGTFFDANGAEIVASLRLNVKDSWDSPGFLARFG